MFKIDLHVHTRYSYDVFTPLQAVVWACRRREIDCLAVTDHNEIEGGLRLREMAPFEVVVGEEVRTTEGEIIGLFLEERIPPGLSPEETIDEIRRQGGVVYLPHPFGGKHRRSGFIRRRLEELVARVDVVEGFNARNRDPACDRLALDFARAHNLPVGAGSDAHTPFELGNAYVEMEPFRTPQQFLSHLTSAQIRGRRTPLWMRLAMNHIVRKGIRESARFALSW